MNPALQRPTRASRACRAQLARPYTARADASSPACACVMGAWRTGIRMASGTRRRPPALVRPARRRPPPMGHLRIRTLGSMGRWVRGRRFGLPTRETRSVHARHGDTRSNAAGIRTSSEGTCRAAQRYIDGSCTGISPLDRPATTQLTRPSLCSLATHSRDPHSTTPLRRPALDHPRCTSAAAPSDTPGSIPQDAPALTTHLQTEPGVAPGPTTASVCRPHFRHPVRRT